MRSPIRDASAAEIRDVAGRVYWTLKTAGVGRVSILDGGMKSWLAAGLPTAAAPSAPAPTTYQVRIDDRWLATRAQVAAASGSSSSRLLDARPAAFFLGEKKHPGGARARHAGRREERRAHGLVRSRHRAARPPQAIGATARRLGIYADLPTVSFCNTGHWAATQWFVLSEVLGGRQVRLYPESMVDWSRAGLAMANVPTRLQQFWMQLRAAFGDG